MVDRNNVIECGNAWVSLGYGIVMQAVRDYRAALRTIDRSKNKDERMSAQFSIDGIKHFFMSNWFSQLCSLDPEALIAAIEIDHKRNRGKIDRRLKGM